MFGDDKDQILVKFNVLQACCGTGKGLVNYYGQLQAVNFTPDNPLCRFKVCGWCCSMVEQVRPLSYLFRQFKIRMPLHVETVFWDSYRGF